MKPFGTQKTQLNNEKLRPYEPLLMTFLRGWDAILGVAFLLALSSFFHKFIPYVREVSFIIFFLTMICFHSIGLYHSWRFSSFRYEISKIFFACFVLYCYKLDVDMALMYGSRTNWYSHYFKILS